MESDNSKRAESPAHLARRPRASSVAKEGGRAPRQRLPRKLPAPSRNAKIPTASIDLKSQLAAIVESSTDAIFSRTFDGTITTWNQAAERMFGFAAHEVIGRSSRDLLPSGRLEEFHELARRIRAGETVQHFETDRLRKNGVLLQVSLALSPIRGAGGALVGISTIARDISEQRQMREALARSERQLKDLFDEASVGLMWLSPKGLVLRANRALANLLRCHAGDCLGKPLSQFHPDPGLVAELLARLARRQSLSNLEIELRSLKGETRPVLMDANGFWENGHLVHSRWFVRDISQRKRLEREVLELSERERRSFAQELHDGLGQQLGGIAYLANVLHEQLAERQAAEATEAERIFVLTRNAIEQTRRLARGLSPIRADPEGLADALRDLVVQTRELFGTTCRFVYPRKVLVEDTVLAGHLYRIAQEAVSNSLRHAKAHSIEIRLSRGRKHLSLRIRDDGSGIGTLTPRRSGLGLRIMRYRADLVRARLAVGPWQAGKGTEISCLAPLASVPAEPVSHQESP